MGRRKKGYGQKQKYVSPVVHSQCVPPNRNDYPPSFDPEYYDNRYPHAHSYEYQSGPPRVSPPPPPQWPRSHWHSYQTPPPRVSPPPPPQWPRNHWQSYQWPRWADTMPSQVPHYYGPQYYDPMPAPRYQDHGGTSKNGQDSPSVPSQGTQDSVSLETIQKLLSQKKARVIVYEIMDK